MVRFEAEGCDGPCSVPIESSGRWGTGDIDTWDIGLITRSSDGVFCGGGGTAVVVGTISVGWAPFMAAALASSALDSALSECRIFPAGGSGSNSRFVCLQCGQTHSFDLI